MRSTLAKLRRRSAVRLAINYGLIAWVTMQAIVLVAPLLRLPEWLPTAALVLLTAGFVVVVAMAFVFEIEFKFAQEPTAGAAALQRSLYVVFFAIASLQLIRWFESSSPITSLRDSHRESTIAILPFMALPGTPEEEAFADGIWRQVSAEFIHQFPDWHVVSREDSAKYRVPNIDVVEAGRTLNAKYVLTGTVQKAGPQLRATIELSDSDVGDAIWSVVYPGDASDMFAFQDKLTESLVVGIRNPLGTARGIQLVPSTIDDPELYDRFLQAKAVLRDRGREGAEESLRSLDAASALLEGIVVTESGNSSAWGTLALTEVLAANYGAPQQFELRSRRGEQAARRALRIDSTTREAYTALAQAEAQRGRWISAENLFLRALELDRGDPDTLHLYSTMLAHLGRLSAAAEYRRKLEELHSVSPVFKWSTLSGIPVFKGYGTPLRSKSRSLIYACSSTGVRAAGLISAVQLGWMISNVTSRQGQRGI
jgi:TolB-like protein